MNSLLDSFRYYVLAADPGLLQLRHAAKTVLAVVIALEALRFMGSDLALYAGISAGFLMQSTAGTTRKTRQIAMGAMGVASILVVGLGSKLSGQQWAKESLLVAAAFTAFYVRRWIHGKAMFPIFAFVLTLLATVQPGGAKTAVPMMAAVFIGFISAFTVYFFVLPDESPHAFRHAAALFLYRLRRGLEHPWRAQADLRAMHRAVAFEEEETEQLGVLAPECCAEVMGNQYEALQVLILLFDIEQHREFGSGSRDATVRFSRDYLVQVLSKLKVAQDLLEA